MAIAIFLLEPLRDSKSEPEPGVLAAVQAEFGGWQGRPVSIDDPLDTGPVPYDILETMVAAQHPVPFERNAEFVVYGQPETPTLLTAVRAVNTECRASTARASIGPAGASGIELRQLDFVLEPGDHGTVDGTNGGKDDWNFPLNVTGSDMELFSISVQTASADCTLDLEFEFSGPRGITRQVVTDPAGLRFHVRGRAPGAVAQVWRSTEAGVEVSND